MNTLSSSSSSSSSLLIEDERDFNSIRPNSSSLSYRRFGDFTPEQVNGLGQKWFSDDPEKQGILQSIWYRHPSNPINKQAYPSDGSSGGGQAVLAFHPPREHQLLGTSGIVWSYQASADNEIKMMRYLPNHFESWTRGISDKGLHPLYLALSGPGTGKSRLLQEFPKLLKHSMLSYCDKSVNGNVLWSRLEKAFVFNVSFENGTPYKPGLFSGADCEVGTRMRFLMSDLRWDQLARMHPCTIGDALTDLATCTQKELKDLSVIICVDGLQKLPHEPGSKTSLFYECIANMCEYINSFPALVVGVIAATTTGPVQGALAGSTQLRVYLDIPSVDGYKLSLFEDNPPSVGVKCMIEDMGGHGRALEILTDVLLRHGYPHLDHPLSLIYNQVICSLNERYPDLMTISNDSVNGMLTAALLDSSLSYDQAMKFEQSLILHGLSRIIAQPYRGYRILIPYILIKLLSSFSSNQLLQRFAFIPEMNDPLSSEGPYWQDWETFNTNVLALKSFLFAQQGEPVSIQTLHYGAKWGNGTLVDLMHVNALHVQEAVHRISTSSFDVNQRIQCQQGDHIVPSNGSDLVMNASGAPAADSFCCRKLVNGPIILESHQYKLQQQPLSQASFISERNKAVPPSTTPSLFLLITSSKSVVSDLPPNCGLVDRSCYEVYFGPYAARAFIHNKVYANLASKKTLMSVPGVGESRADIILTNRPFSGAADCVQRTGIPSIVAQCFCFEKW